MPPLAPRDIPSSSHPTGAVTSRLPRPPTANTASPSALLHQSEPAATGKYPLVDSSSLYTRIDDFTGTYGWLQLDYSCPVYFRGCLYPSAYHSLLGAQYPSITPQAIEQCTDEGMLLDAVKEQQECPEWPKVRLKVMEMILRDKFRRNEDLRQKLLDTGSRELVWNNKSNTFWGQVNMRGQNHLGRIMQEIRDNIKQGDELDSWVVLCCDIEVNKNARPIIRLREEKEGLKNATLHELSGQAYYLIGKLPDNDVVALNPSVSRKHALLSIKKGGKALLFDLKSKAKTYLNGELISMDHVGVPVKTGDYITLGSSSRHYYVEIDDSHILQFLEKKNRDLNREILKLSEDIKDPLGLASKSQFKIFVGGLPFKTTKDDLQDMFQSFGSIKAIDLPQQNKQMQEIPEVGEQVAERGIAFIEFESAASARAALDKDGRSLNGRILKVALADVSRGKNPPQTSTGVSSKALEQSSNHANNEKASQRLDFERSFKHHSTRAELKRNNRHHRERSAPSRSPKRRRKDSYVFTSLERDNSYDAHRKPRKHIRTHKHNGRRDLEVISPKRHKHR